MLLCGDSSYFGLNGRNRGLRCLAGLCCGELGLLRADAPFLELGECYMFFSKQKEMDLGGRGGSMLLLKHSKSISCN